VLRNSLPLKKQFEEKQKTDIFLKEFFCLTFGFSVSVEIRGHSTKTKAVQLKIMEDAICNYTVPTWFRNGSDNRNLLQKHLYCILPFQPRKEILDWMLMQSIAQSQQAILFLKLQRASFLGVLARTTATTLWECASVVRECASVVKEWAPVVKECTSVVKECASVAKNRLL
jgi:hypothetical protein